VNSAPYLLADVELEDVLATWRSMNSSALGGMVLFCAIGFVVLLVMVWAVFFRRKKHRRRSHRHSQRHSYTATESPEAQAAEPAVSSEREGRRSRRSRRRHRVRNPTLAETGGLPPVRPEGPPEAQA
jgi:uncharacterized membrane protein